MGITKPANAAMTEMTLNLEPNEAAPRLTRSRLEHMRELLEPRFEDVRLVLSELVSNSVQHTKSKSLHVRIAADTEVVRLEVQDEGSGFDFEKQASDGFGLRILDTITDRWGISEGERFVVWAELFRKTSE